MFDLGWAELMIVAVIALVVVGPKDLPGLLAKVGRFVGKARAMAGQFQSVMMDAAREAELEEIKRELNQNHMIGAKPESAENVGQAPSAQAAKPNTATETKSDV